MMSSSAKKPAIKVFDRPHNYLVKKSGLYAKWHQKNYSSAVHFFILVLGIFAAAALGYYLSLYNYSNKPTYAGTLNVPTIASPNDGDILTSKRPNISWKASSGANAYRIKLYQDDTLLKDTTVTTANYTPDFDLADKGNYYWTVQAINQTVAAGQSNVAMAAGNGTQIAARRIKSTVPSTPTLASPPNGYSTEATSLATDWYDVSNSYSPVKYVLQYSTTQTVDTTGAFISPNFTTTPQTTSALTLTGLTPATYFWHVQAINNIGEKSSWSAYRSFVITAPVVTPPPTTPPPVVNPPAPVVTINSQSAFSPYWNFATDYSRTSNFVMPSSATNWVGAFVPDSGDALASFKAFETTAGKVHPVANKFVSFYWNANFPTSTAQSFYNSNKHYLLTWEPWNPSNGATQPEYSNAAITANQTFTPYSGGAIRSDDYVTRWATQIKAYKKPVYLRFAHEMNGDWYPWGAANGNTPASYVAMWKHVHDIFEKNGVKNVRWVWCVNNDQATTFNPATYYPGDNYVDVMAIDGYNWGTSQSWSSWTSFSTNFANTYGKLTTLSSKDIWIAETGSVEAGGDKAAWITSAYSYAEASMPRVKNMLWFNSDVWAITTSANATNAYKAAVQNY